MEKMTKREFYTALVNYAETGILEYTDAEGNVVAVEPVAVKEFAENEIQLLDKKATKAKERKAIKKAEGDELTDIVRDAMSTEEFETREDIFKKLEVAEDVTIAKVGYRLTTLVNNGEAEKTEITLPAEVEGGKKRKVMGYRKLA